MKDTKRLTAIMTTATLVLLMTSSLVTLSKATIINNNPNAGTVSTYASYLGASYSAATAAAKYGDLLQYPCYQYGWADAERTGFNPGPAPDRPDILWMSNVTTVASNPLITAVSSPQIAFDGKLFLKATIQGVSNIVALDPFTGRLIWNCSINYARSIQPTPTVGAFGNLYCVDEHHLGALTGGGSGLPSASYGFSMINADTGQFLWFDPTIGPNAVYHAAIMDQESHMLLGPMWFPSTAYYGTDYGWNMSNPDVNMGYTGVPNVNGISNRVQFSRVRDEPGHGPMIAYGAGLVVMGSYSSYSIYALNVTTGEKVWETNRMAAAGYAGCYGDGKFFVACESMYVCCYNATTGELLWENDHGLVNRAFYVYGGNYAYGNVYWHDLGIGFTGAMDCFDGTTGEMLWASPEVSLIGYYFTCVADGKVYGMQSDGSTATVRARTDLMFSCWDAFTGEVLWSIQGLTITNPAVAYGNLYFTVSSVEYCLSTATTPTDWAMWRGQPGTGDTTTKQGVAAGTGPINLNAGPKWTYTTGAGIISSPAVVDGKVYIGSDDQNLYCLDAYTGSLIWKFPIGSRFYSSPAVSDGKVFTGGDDGNFYCLDANTGELLWKVFCGTYKTFTVSLGQFNLRSSPIVYNNKIYVGSVMDNCTYCISTSGSVLWKYDTGAPVICSAAIANNTVYITNWDAKVYHFTLDGAVIPCGGQNYFCVHANSTAGASFGWRGMGGGFTPVIVGDRYFMGVDATMMYCYNVTTGAQIYAVAQPKIASEESNGSPLYVPDTAGGRIYTQGGPNFDCINATSGANIWCTWAGWQIWGSAVYASGINVANSVLYAGCESYAVKCYNASNGAPLSWYTTGGNVPGSVAIWDGKLYFGSGDNKVYCFEDHPTQQMAMSMSLDKTTVDLNNTESVTVTAQLTHVPSLNPYEDLGLPAPVPPLPNASVLVTFTDPDGVDTNMTATTDRNGMATVTFTPNKVGTWKAIAWYTGEDHPTFSYGYAFSDQMPIEATQTITLPPPPPETGTNIPMEYVYAAIAVIVIVIVAAAALMLLRKRKK